MAKAQAMLERMSFLPDKLFLRAVEDNLSAAPPDRQAATSGRDAFFRRTCCRLSADRSVSVTVSLSQYPLPEPLATDQMSRSALNGLRQTKGSDGQRHEVRGLDAIAAYDPPGAGDERGHR